jgi:cytochrome c peroxidase
VEPGFLTGAGSSIMRNGARHIVLALGVLVALSACQDAPTSPDGDGPLFNRGQTKKGGGEQPPADLEALGKLLYEDITLSVNKNQSCQTCHEPGEGFAAALTGVVSRGSVVQGSQAGKFGDRKPPTAAYATLTPLYSGGNNPVGGLFWDGRATGHDLGNPAADQAMGPFLNPMEQALPDKACVIYRIRQQPVYSAAPFWNAIQGITFPGDAETFCGTWRSDPDDHMTLTPADRAIVNGAYEQVALAIAAFEATFNKFSSRFDRGQMSAMELEGQKLFSGKGKCQQCHSNKGENPLFTDFAFHNLGVPKNPDNPFYDFDDPDSFDRGLGGFTGQARHMGKFRTPTVRNVGMGSNRTFMHNGSLVSLEKVVDFYNTRDVLPVCKDRAVLEDPARWGSTDFGGAGCWPPAEFGGNLDTKNMGKLGLTTSEVEAIVAYMKAMTDQ